MVYMAGDNNLTEDMVFALKDLYAEAPLKGDVIVAQLDPNGAGMGAQRYDFTDGKATLEECRDKEYVSTHLNTGTVEALVAFVSWALERAKKHEARDLNYLLILSGHGSGTTEDFLLRDNGSLDSLTIPELRKALSIAAAKIGETTGGRKNKIDIVGMDACYMGMGEVAGQIRDYANILIAPEGTVPAFGWPYGRLIATARKFRAAHDNQPMPPRRLAESIVQNYVEHYSDYDRSAGRSVDLAAIDLTKVDDLDEAMANLARSLNEANQDRIVVAHWRAQTYKAEQFVDLHDFCIQTYKQFHRVDESVIAACVRVIQILDGDTQAIADALAGRPLTTGGGGCIIRCGCSGFAHQHSYGLAVYFPWAFVAAAYKRLSFGRDREWYDFLQTHVKATRRESRFAPLEKGARVDAEALKAVCANKAQADRIACDIDEIIEEVSNQEIAPQDLVVEFERRALRRTGLRRSRYTGDIDRYTGDYDRYPGEPSRSSFDRQRCVKNFAIPGIGKAYWPPFDERSGGAAKSSTSALAGTHS
jgi:hypothetical protein